MHNTDDTQDWSRPLSWWCAQHAHELLTADDERALGAAVQAGRAPDAPDEARAAGDAARNALVERNVRLAIHEARKGRYQGRGLAIDDLIQYAVLGLITAADKYDPSRGLRFSTMATWWIRQSLARALDTDHGTIRLPVHLSDRIRRIKRAGQLYVQQHGRQPDDATWAAAAGCSVEQLQRAREALQLRNLVSLNWRAHSDLGEEHDEIEGFQADPRAEFVHEAEQSDRGDLIAGALAMLPEREREIVAATFGLGGRERETLERIGRRLGLTRERVRQLKEEALSRLRTRHELRGLIDAA